MKKQTKLLNRVSVWGLSVTCVCTALHANEAVSDAANNEVLVPYVVVATRTPLGLDRVSPSVSYISAEEMEQWQDRALSDVLAQEAGMVVITSGGQGSQTSLFTRGTNSDHTAFFMDGRRLNTGFGNQYALERLSLNNLSSVQIQKGASSVNYGSSGIGGVVDLRTRSAFDVDGNVSTVTGEAGSNDYARGAFNTAFSEGKLGVSVSGSALTTENERRDDDYKYEGIGTRLDYRLTDVLSLEFVGQYDHTDKQVPGADVSPTPFDEQETDDWFVSPGIRYATDELTVHLFYSYSESRMDLDQMKPAYSGWTYLGDFPLSNEIKVESDEVNLQADYSVTDDLLLTSGMVYRHDDATNSNMNFDPLGAEIPYDERFDQFGLFGQALWIVSESLELRAGVRYDHYSDFDSQNTGSVEGIYTFPDAALSLFAKVASSYAPPSAVDLAYDSDSSTPLNPEESDSYEIGLRHELLDGDLRYSLVLFRNEIDHLLGYDQITYDTYNVDSATTEGVEFSVDYAVTEKLDLAGSYTYLTATDDDSDERLLRRPRHMLQLSASYQWTDAIHCGVQGVGYFDREDIDAATYGRINQEDSFVVNLVVNWDLNERFSLFARAENLFDESYEAVNGYPSIGTTGYVGARLSF